MDYFDPWKGANQATQTLANLGSQITKDREEERQARMSALQEQQLRSTLSESLRQKQVDAGARQALRDAIANNPTTFAPPQATAPSLASGLNPGMSAADPTLTEMTPAKPVNHDKILLDYYRQNDPARAAGMEKLMVDKFKALSEVDPAHAIDWYSQVSGIDFKYAGKKGDYSIIHSPDGAIVAVNTKDPTDAKIIQQGVKKLEHIPEGAAVPDGKGGYIIPAPKAEKSDKVQLTEIPSPDGKTAQKFLVNTVDGSKTPVGSPYKVSSQVPRVTVTNGTTGDNAQIAAWADKIAKGETTLSEIPGRGPIRSQVIQYLTANYPEVNLAEAGAKKKWAQSQGTMQTLALVDATKGILQDMRGAYAKLNRTDIPAVNAAQDVWQKWSGNPDRSEYMSLKNYGIQEVEKMLSGSGAMSDHRIKLAFDNLKESNTPDQFERAISGIQRVMGERQRATRQGPYITPQTTTQPTAAPKTWADYKKAKGR